MSSISSVSGGSALYSYLQNISATTQTQNTTPTATTESTSTQDTGSDAPVQGAHHHHHHHGGGQESQSLQQIQQAVTTALQSASQNGTDPNQAIEDAIKQVFQNQNSQPQSNNGTTDPSNPTGNPANTSATNTTTTNGASSTSSLQAFYQTLQSAGINPQQFQQDFLTAVQSAQSGSADPSALSSYIPPGSIIDTTG